MGATGKRQLLVNHGKNASAGRLDRNHGSIHIAQGVDRSLADDRIVAVLRLRERLRPYIHEQMRVASRDGVPPMRPLWVDFPQDPGAWRTEDAFLFGPDLLIAPVLEPGARVREVYLPAGRAWVEAGTGDSHDGGATVRVPLSLDRIPVFAAAGAEVLDAVR